MKIKIHQSLIVIGLLVLVTSNIALFSSNYNYRSTFIETNNQPLNSGLGSNLSPFFNHVEEDTTFYLQLNDTVDN